MIKMSELLKGLDVSTLPQDHKRNLETLIYRMNKVRQEYGKPMIVTSGYRSIADHLRIYRNKGITDQSKIPMASKHLYGQAVDIADPKGELQEWCKGNQTLLRQLGLWMEDFSFTKGWVHFQCVPYGSYKHGGSLWFRPY